MARPLYAVERFDEFYLLQAEFTTDVQFFYDTSGNLDHSLNHFQPLGTDSAKGISLVDTADFTHVRLHHRCRW